ncbi:MAG: Rieske 2Fe-2S domain-containing protein [Xanthomonadales bacterium]|nr:Rieske 2Fe-2S domain-containing protein [Xanthomonadales bacterium]NIX12153.1 Rieske 2Fe-2S domain-containing protein [Xanthomonadales bacterium]
MVRDLCGLGEIGDGLEVQVDGPDGPVFIALFRLAGDVHAYLNACPHLGRSLSLAPDEFCVGDDGRLLCPHHGACFELATGKCVSGPCVGDSLKRLEVEIAGDRVLLREPG